jgi:glycerophosphoryl diester phosphodiesterase
MVTLIAHGHGNRLDRVEWAIAAGVDLIETDLRLWDGVVWVRHEHRVGRLPLLSHWRPRGIHRAGPFAVALGPLYLRLEPRPLRLSDVLAQASGRTGLLLDLKSRQRRRGDAALVVEAVLADLATAGFTGRIEFSGDWTALDLLRDRAPEFGRYYSVGDETEWRRFLLRLDDPNPIKAVSLRQRLLTEERGEFLRRAAVDRYLWDVADQAAATAAIARGATGIIADDLAMLRLLAATTSK